MVVKNINRKNILVISDVLKKLILVCSVRKIFGRKVNIMLIEDLFNFVGFVFGLNEKIVGRIIKFVVNVIVVLVNVISLVDCGMFDCWLI